MSKPTATRRATVGEHFGPARRSTLLIAKCHRKPILNQELYSFTMFYIVSGGGDSTRIPFWIHFDGLTTAGKPMVSHLCGPWPHG